MLEAAIHTFNEERTKDHLLDIVEILRDSYVWIPCNAVMSDEDKARLLAMLEEKKMELSVKHSLHMVKLDCFQIFYKMETTSSSWFFLTKKRWESMAISSQRCRSIS